MFRVVKILVLSIILCALTSFSPIVHEITYLFSSRIGGIVESKGVDSFDHFMKKDFNYHKIIVDNVLVYENIKYIQDSVKIASENQNEFKSKFKCIDLILLMKDIHDSIKYDTVYINYSDPINNKYFRINDNYYYDEDYSIHDVIAMEFPCYLLRAIGKKCNCR